MTNDEIWLRTVLQKNAVPITDIQLKQLSAYSRLLEEWNTKINLVSRKDQGNFWRRHILVSLIFLFKIEFPVGARLLDLGTGGGLPGIPLAILREDLRITLLDSIRKKTLAVEEMVSTLSLTNVEVICGRAEEVGRGEQHNSKFDAVIARAVAELDDLIDWAYLFLVKGAQEGEIHTSPGKRVLLSRPALVTLKGGDLAGEIERARKKHPETWIDTIEGVFNGSENLENANKKLILVHYNKR